MANWLERARREFQEAADPATANTADRQVSTVSAVGHPGSSKNRAGDLAGDPPANAVTPSAIGGGDGEELDLGRRDEGLGEFLERAGRRPAKTANTLISTVSAVARSGDSENCAIGLAGDDPCVALPVLDAASANEKAWRYGDDPKRAAQRVPPSARPIAPVVPVRCIDCQHFERASHPRLGTCRENQPPPPCGMFWDTDRRGCLAFKAASEASPELSPAAPRPEPPDPPLTPVTKIRAWLARIGETDPDVIEEVLAKCLTDQGAMDYFLGRADESRPALPIWDDRRYCTECLNLTERGLCLAVWRGEMRGVRTWQPDQSRPWRCVGYAPGPDDPDRRPGRERWPFLLRYERKQ